MGLQVTSNIMEKRKSQAVLTSFFAKKSKIDSSQPAESRQIEQVAADRPNRPIDEEPSTSGLPVSVPVTVNSDDDDDDHTDDDDAENQQINKMAATDLPNPNRSVDDKQPEPSTISVTVESNYDDVGVFNRSELRDCEKIKLMKGHFCPDKSFIFPVRQHKCKNLKFNSSWLGDFPWLVYSKTKNGGYCLPCVLFARKPDGRGCHFGVLVEKPFIDFRKALGKEGVLPNHESNIFHKSAVAAYHERMHADKNPEERVDILLQKHQQTQYEMNKVALGSIIECIIYLGRQGQALRGHRDDSTADPEVNKGNLQELIQFRAKTDETLRKFIQSCPGNATYVSKTIQNEIIGILGDIVRESITSNITTEHCPFYSIIADELTDDIANKHILSICLRFLQYDGEEFAQIQESLLDFTYVERGTAEHLVKVIRTKLVECGLNPANVRGQSYDTTASMASNIGGVQGLFRRDVPRAIYTPCNSHKLNLVIASASKLPQIRNCITAVNAAYLFLNASHKRQGFFERVLDIVNGRETETPQPHSDQRKLKGLCKTRWVERFEAIDNFIDLTLAVVTMCDIIVHPHLYQDDEQIRTLMEEKWSWDAETKTKAQGILSSLGHFETIVSLIVLKNVLHPLREITIKLQKRDLDIRNAYSLLDSVKLDMENLRKEVDDRFNNWYTEIKKIANRLGTEEHVPRARASIYRATHPAGNPKEYYRRAIAIPFIEDVITQLNERFSDASTSIVSAFMKLIPSVIKMIEIKEIPTIVEKLVQYEPDVPRFGSLQTELEIWRGRWRDHPDPPDTLLYAMKCCAMDLFPNIHVLLQLGCLIPVTSCEAERSFSAVRRTKTVLRSTMGEERLSSLVLVNTNRQLTINVDDVVRRFIQKKPRRLFSALCEK